MGWPSLQAPSSSSSLSRGWTFRAIHMQNVELTLETCAPESKNTVTFCPLDNDWCLIGLTPLGRQLGSRFKNGIGWGHLSWACPSGHLHTGQSWSGVGVGTCRGPNSGLDGCHWWGWAAFPQFPPGWFKANTSGRAFPGHMAPPQGSKALERVCVLASSYTLPLILGLQLPWSLPQLPVPSNPMLLWVGCGLESSGPGPPLPLWEFGQLGVLLLLHPQSVATFLGTAWCTWGTSGLSGLGQGSH